MFPWTTFLPYVLIVTITPGPNNIMSMNNAAQKGLRRALPFNFGILIGALIVLSLCTLFSTLLFALIPRIEFPMKILGAVYMLYLALKTLLSSKNREVKNSNGSFIAGIALQFINPKLMLFSFTTMSSFILPWYTSIPVLICFVVLLTIIGFVSTVCWAVSGSLFSKIFNEHKRILGIIMALLLVYCAASLFL